MGASCTAAAGTSCTAAVASSFNLLHLLVVAHQAQHVLKLTLASDAGKFYRTVELVLG